MEPSPAKYTDPSLDTETVAPERNGSKISSDFCGYPFEIHSLNSPSNFSANNINSSNDGMLLQFCYNQSANLFVHQPLVMFERQNLKLIRNSWHCT